MSLAHTGSTAPAPQLHGLSFERGYPLPLGAELRRDGVNFAIFSRHATAVTLVLFRPGEETPWMEIPLNPDYHRTGEIWHILVKGVEAGTHYSYRMDRQPNHQPYLHRYNPRLLLQDPYAKLLSGGFDWGHRFGPGGPRRRSVVAADDFDWEDDHPLNIPLADSVIYEMHVRGFTRHPSSAVAHPGTFAGVIEKIPYLKSLGVTAVELLPVYEFEEEETDRRNPLTGEVLLNYWGYQPLAFFTPNAAYCSSHRDGDQVTEFKRMVKELHRAGIEVILDVVFNHTAEGDERGITFSFRGIDNLTYYMINRRNGTYLNYSGCGNTFNCNHPVVRDLIVDCLRYWVSEMHVDGFRFDLASILGRDQDGTVLANPPLLERLSHDPVLAGAKLIAEAWDAAGLYQVGTFPAWGRWAEWNGKFRDDIRRWVKGDEGLVSTLATRICGSPDLYQTSGRQPFHSINFVTCHDGFTLRDLVSYNYKHNEANGENNLDGANDNFSWNCGVEGPTADAAINRLRLQQMKNFLALLMISSGTPMIRGGDEIAGTQLGNNNAYCQDNEISWMDWRLTDSYGGLLRFVRLLIAFRRRHPVLRRETFGPESGVLLEWHGVRWRQPDWSSHSRTLAMEVLSTANGFLDHLYFVTNAHWEDHRFELPPLSAGVWRRVFDTSLPEPDDICDPGREAPLSDPSYYVVRARSCILLMACQD